MARQEYSITFEYAIGEQVLVLNHGAGSPGVVVDLRWSWSRRIQYLVHTTNEYTDEEARPSWYSSGSLAPASPCSY